MKFRVFICYSQLDFLVAGKNIRDYLSDLLPDTHVYIDQTKSKGLKWRPENERELRTADLVVLIITPAALQSEEVQKEIKIAKETGKIIIPCKDENTDLEWDELPYHLGELDGIKFESEEKLQRNLFREIKKIRIKLSKDTLESKIKEQDSIFVEMNKKTYFSGETILVTGKVKDLLAGIPVSLLVIAPNGNLVTIAQINVNSDKKFNTEITTGGPLMKMGGMYTIRVQYGNQSRIAETVFNFGKLEKIKPQHIIKLLLNSSISENKKLADPEILKIKLGDSIKWINEDSAAHTITSGSIGKGPKGIFDSGLLMSGNSFEVTFRKKGTYKYFSMVHPWKECSVIVD